MSRSPETLTRRLEHALQQEQLVAQITRLTGPEIGRKMLVFPDAPAVGSLGDDALDETARRLTLARMRAGESQATTVEVADSRLFIEIFPPPPHLILIGGVHVAVPLVRFGQVTGFRVTVVDPRSTFASDARFAGADEIITEWPDEALAGMRIGPETYIAILTHDPKLDEPALEAAVGRGAAYIGAIGSRETHAERFERMARRGVPAERLAEVHAPIGLNIGAENPAEIALAIMAEIVAVRRGGTGGFLHEAG